jgi:CheY-like chemotaxis protein
LIEAHGGNVTAKSEGPGKGATFAVTIPAAASLPARDGELSGRQHPTASVAATEARSLSSLAGLRILIVDDEPDNLNLIGEIVKMADGDVRLCTSAAAGLREVTAWRPDILISDIEMPGEDGYTFIRRVRALDAASGGKVPAIAVTAYGRIEDRLRTLSAGFSMHVPKPVDPAELTTIVASLAGR